MDYISGILWRKTQSNTANPHPIGVCSVALQCPHDLVRSAAGAVVTAAHTAGNVLRLLQVSQLALADRLHQNCPESEAGIWIVWQRRSWLCNVSEHGLQIGPG